MISPIGREVDRGGGTITTSMTVISRQGQQQQQQQQQRARDCSELLHKRVSERRRVALTPRDGAPDSIRLAWQSMMDGERKFARPPGGIDRATVARELTTSRRNGRREGTNLRRRSLSALRKECQNGVHTFAVPSSATVHIRTQRCS